MLQGTGTIGGIVMILNGGTLKPGNSIGRQNYTSGLNLNSGSTLTIEFSPTQSSLAYVTGAANIAGATLNLIADVGTYSNVTWTILQASEVTGTFAHVTVPMGLTLFTEYLPPLFPTMVVITTNGVIVNSLPTNCFAPGSNPMRIANYLNSIIEFDSIQLIIAGLTTSSCSDLIEAMNAISPARNASSSVATSNQAFRITDIFSSRLGEQRLIRSMKQRSGAIASLYETSLQEGLIAQNANQFRASQVQTPAGSTTTYAREESKQTVWVGGFGDFTHQDGSAGSPAFDTTAGGCVLASDYFGHSDAMVGAAAGYAYSSIDQSHHWGSGAINSYFGNLYGTLYLGNGYLDLSFLGSYNQYKNSRSIAIVGFDEKVKSSHNGYQLTPYGSVGYDFGFNWGVIEPFAAFDWTYSFEQKLRESGAESFDMEQKSRSYSMLRSQIGLNLYESWNFHSGLLIVRETASYVCKKPWDVGKITAAIVGAGGSFTVDSYEGIQNLGLCGVEMFFRTQSGFFASGKYSGEFGRSYLSNAVEMKIGKYF